MMDQRMRRGHPGDTAPSHAVERNGTHLEPTTRTGCTREFGGEFACQPKVRARPTHGKQRWVREWFLGLGGRLASANPSAPPNQLAPCLLSYFVRPVRQRAFGALPSRAPRAPRRTTPEPPHTPAAAFRALCPLIHAP